MNCDSLFHRSLFLYCDRREKCLLCPMWLFPPAIPSVATGKIILQTFVFVLWSIEITPKMFPIFFLAIPCVATEENDCPGGVALPYPVLIIHTRDLQSSRRAGWRLKSSTAEGRHFQKRADVRWGKKKKALQRRSCEVSYKKTMLDINCCSDSASFFKIWCRWVDCADYIWVNSLPCIDN